MARCARAWLSPMDYEINRFKRDINLIRLAASHGYAVDPKKSSPRSVYLRGTQGDRLLVSRSSAGAWRYCSLDHPDDNGDLITFVRRRQFGHLRQAEGVREVCRQLRQTLGTELSAPTDTHPFPRPARVDREGIRQQLAQARQPRSQPYLESRGLSRETLLAPRFGGKWLEHGPYRNVVFPHVDERGVCGFEVKNRAFSGFSSGGMRGLWASRTARGDRAMVVAESAIDALSYAQIHPDASCRYLSSGGALSTRQLELLGKAMAKMPAGRVVAALDADRAGHAMAARLEQVAAGHPQLTFVRAAPTLAKDWNEQLQRSLGRRAVRSAELGLER